MVVACWLFSWLLVGGEGFEPSKAYANRVTVCPIWPLWNPPKHLFTAICFEYSRFNKFGYLARLLN